jgi:hypothetical protein
MSTKRRIAFWTSTAVLVFVLASGGIGEFGHMWGTLETVTILGYPSYVLTILGAWKLAAAVALLLPLGVRLKEWAYAGIFFNMTGAAASHALAGDFGPGGFHISVTLAFAALALLTRALAGVSHRSGERSGTQRAAEALAVAQRAIPYPRFARPLSEGEVG